MAVMDEYVYVHPRDGAEVASPSDELLRLPGDEAAERQRRFVTRARQAVGATALMLLVAAIALPRQSFRSSEASAAAGHATFSAATALFDASGMAASPGIAPNLAVPPAQAIAPAVPLRATQQVGAVPVTGRPFIKAISYAPVPLKELSYLPHDDFMSKDTRSLWSSSSCRRDLQVMKAMGANAVRLYGNDAELNHKDFLDEALNEGMKVIPGLSDYAYIQMEDSCMSTNYNCFTQIGKQYTSNLQNGFLRSDGTYHPAIEMIVLINEPDLKFEMQHGTAGFCRAVVSALDAVLEAEAVAGVVGELPKFSIVVSFAVCQACSSFQGNPGLGQMDELRRAFHNPELIGYTPKHNIWDAYQKRVVNGINTANSVSEFLQYFMEPYTSSFPQMPLFVGEFHSPVGNMKDEVATLLQVAESDSLVLGMAFFEFQVRYDKGPKDMVFGMFGLGNAEQGTVQIGGQAFTAYCLTPQPDAAGQLVPQSITEAFGGAGMDWSGLCTRTCDVKDKKDEEYDCDKDYGQWGMMWSPLQQKFCCRTTGRACSPSPSQSAASSTRASQASTTAPSTPSTPSTSAKSTTKKPTTSGMPYDCKDGRDVTEWSTIQREFCCLKMQLGCPKTTTTTTVVTTPKSSGEHDCEQDYGQWATKWSEKKIAWCCNNKQRGCSDKTAMQEATTDAYKCTDDGRWAEEWPAGKQAWCCLYKRKGCHGDVTADGFVKTANPADG